MGLDSVELVMRVEESFGVTIADAEAVRCETPVDVIFLVLGKLCGMAMDAFREAIPEWTMKERRREIERELMEYCERCRHGAD